MRAPLKSESDAFRFALGGVAVIGISVLVGWLASPLVGVAVLAIALAVAAAAYLVVGRRDRPQVLRRALREGRGDGAATASRHVLVIANETLSGTELREHIKRHGGSAVELDVLAPVLTSHSHYGVSDIDSERAEAEQRLERSLAWAREQGLVARGEVGDPNPTTAIEDELRDFAPDEVIVVTHPAGEETWQERHELERLRRELDVPVKRVVAG